MGYLDAWEQHIARRRAQRERLGLPPLSPAAELFARASFLDGWLAANQQAIEANREARLVERLARYGELVRKQKAS